MDGIRISDAHLYGYLAQCLFEALNQIHQDMGVIGQKRSTG